MTYLVTGGFGFIGSAIVKKLIGQQHKVYVIDNLSSGLKSNLQKDSIYVEGDFSQDDVLAKITNIKFDGIFHIGGQSSGEISFSNPVRDLNANTISTLKLLQFCIKSSCPKIVYASTMSVYGDQSHQEQFSEEDQTLPKSFYAVGKLASEQYIQIFAKEYGLKYSILRYFNVYGPGQNLANIQQGMVSIYLKQFLDHTFKEVLVKGSLDRFRDLIYIDDVVNISLEAMYNDAYQTVINIGTGRKTTVKFMIDLIRKKLNSKKNVIVAGTTPGDQFGIYANNAKLLSLYKKPLIQFEDGLARMIKWGLDQ